MYVVAPADGARKRAADEIAHSPGPPAGAPVETLGAQADERFGSPLRRKTSMESTAETSPIQGLVRPTLRAAQAPRAAGVLAAECGDGALRQEALRRQLAAARAAGDHIGDLARLDRERAATLERQNTALRAEIGRLSARRGEQDDRIVALEEHCAALEARNVALVGHLAALRRDEVATEAAADAAVAACAPADMTCGESLDWGDA